MTFSPRLDVLPAAQRALWPHLSGIPRSFVLYGGTALALRLGHRVSVDFDFFSHDPLDHASLERDLDWLRESETLQLEPNARTVVVESEGGSVKVSLFGSITFGRVGEPEPTDDGVLRAASLRDLAGTKMKALLQRVEAKDYLDIAALLDAGLPIEEILGAARTLFGATFNPLVAKKTLAYFEGGDLETLEPTVREKLIAQATRDVDVVPLAKLSSRLD